LARKDECSPALKLHKAQLASDRMSCHSATANQVRLVLHTAAFWLMHGVRAAIPKASPLASAEFATIRQRLIKIGARVIEHIARIRIQLPTSYPVGTGFVASLARSGGNVTGLSNQAVDLGTKRLGLLREVLPALNRVGIMANAGYAPTGREIAEVQAAARTLGLEAVILEIRREEDILTSIDALKARAVHCTSWAIR
jgi:hypothetical protein